MINVLIFHGVSGHPQENWFPWIKKELKISGNNVIIPQFPTPENQTLKNWLNVLKKYAEYINKDTILIGHSLGVPFTLNVMEKYSVKAAFLIAGFVGSVNNDFNESMKTFAQKKFNWEQIKDNCSYFKIYHSDNDPYLSLNEAERVSKGLGVKITLIKNAGHFNKSAGYDKFNLLLKDIKKIL